MNESKFSSLIFICVIMRYISAVATWINLERPHTVMFSYHCTIAWHCRICDSLCYLFYLTVVFVSVLCVLLFFDKSLSSGVAAMLLMLLFLTFYSLLACYDVYRFVASSLFLCCPIILYMYCFCILFLCWRYGN